MSIKGVYVAGAEAGGWACRRCLRTWDNGKGRHRKRLRASKGFLRYAAHKFANLHCRFWVWEHDGLVDVSPWITYVQGNTWTVTPNPTPWRRG